MTKITMTKTNIEKTVEGTMQSFHLEGKITEGHAEDIKAVLTQALTHQAQMMEEEALQREKLFKDVHRLELDAISMMSLEKFMKWSEHRKPSPLIKKGE